MSSGELRGCYLSQKWMDPDEVQNRREVAQDRAAAFLPGEVSVAASFDDFQERFRIVGTWSDWTSDVAQGVRSGDYRPRYHLFLLDEPFVGRATAQIIEGALGAGKPVLYADSAWPLERPFREVVKVVCVNEDSWVGSWELVVRGEPLG